LKLTHAAQLAFAVGLIGSFNISQLQKQTIAEPSPTSALLADHSYHPDTLNDQDGWIAKVKTLAANNQGQQYPTCLFGDSISSGLKNSLQPTITNFAMGGLSTVSLTTQLKYLNQAGVRCQDPSMAGPLQRVDEINALMQQVATSEDVGLMTSGLESLYYNHALKDELTTDGVHLNDNGNQIYRQALLAIAAIMP
jgi:hypothetical protein